MGEKTDMEIFLENVPSFQNPVKALFSYIYHFTIFLLIMICFWWISSNYLLFSFPAQLLVASGSTVPFMYIAKNFDKIRDKYLNKYKKTPWQHFWYNYSYTSPLGAAALYFPILLITQENIPVTLSNLPDLYIAQSLFPIYVSLPLGLIILIFGILLVKPAKGYDRDMDAYLRVIQPEKHRLIIVGIYKYIRHPRFLSRLVLAIGLAVIANNLFAVGLAIVHFIPYVFLLIIEDKEYARRYGAEIRKYQEQVPALWPKYGNWKKFFKLILKSRQKGIKIGSK